MKEYFKRVKITTLILSLLYLFFGVALIVWPETAKLTIICLFGALIALKGIFSIVNYFVYGYEHFGFMSGVLNLTVGILVMACCEALSNSAVFSLVFGFMFIFNGLGRMQTSMDYRKLASNTWWIDLIFASIIFAFGIVVLCNPFASEKILLIFLGASIIVDAVCQIVTLFVVSGKVRKIKHTVRDLFKREIPQDDNVIDVTDYTNEK